MRLRLLPALLPVAAVLLFVLAHRAGADSTEPSRRADGTLEIPAAARAAGLRFSPDVTPGDRAWIEAAIAGARPEARTLIDEVDGLVTISSETGAAPGSDGVTLMGLTREAGTSFQVSLNVSALDGERTIDRAVVVLHELGHVVDFALIGPALDDRLDAGIPGGGSCGSGGGQFGGCAPAPERIADTFAKWALGGAVSAVGAGYAIATPASLETWGAPLGVLATQPPEG